MDISAINNKYFNSTVQSTSTKSTDDDFEKRLTNALENKDEKELKKVCKEFEGILLEIMYKQMKATVPKTDLIPTDPGREIFEDMLDEELVKESTEHTNLGLADSLYKQLSRNLKSG
ncbi:rod-binding protein [Acetivibrio mesophilus]|uniref:Flagellar biosynthesis protein FlgJ n=1 Tax=Acetivibrio mesophilus TaxID=2487273 RepID=A0A4Q0I670_9FIRM|nr:rod-binding protein [Acetivibrio mesophilus]ODM27427.1 flagellar biosynthesis protein FlgJ [Clostridium sp. Bc-iso-3]RXE59387.1 flagellar biosynthesis protein FlgJ [Acetivibrio mesophilus]HHV30168.1 flagellar biosynthesis protein FlgJ [Clostridium sp.]